VLAVDLPLVGPDLLLALTAWPEADAVLPRPEGRLQPLCALYRRASVLPLARERLATGRLALMGLLEQLELGVLDGPDLEALDPEGGMLTNVNTPDDWARVKPRIRPVR
jgi:molybdopterin-guanine dinucleotide biosynthesis protein A